MDAIGHEVERRTALHLDGIARVVREYEDRHVIRRLITPPALPRLVGPGPADGAEHVASQDPRAYIGKASRREVFVDSYVSAAASVHLLEGLSREEPLHQRRAADA